MTWPFDTDDSDPWLSSLRRFGASEMPATLDLRNDEGRARAVWRKAGEFGIFAQAFPEAEGGLASSPSRVVEALEALGYGSGNNGLLFAFGAHMWAVIKPLIDFASAEVKKTYLRPLIDGQLIGAHAASEFGAGSDVMAMQSRCEPTDDGWLLNGVKAWTSNAPLADVFVFFATEDPRLHFRGVSAFVLSRKDPGVTVLPAERKVGLHDASMAQVVVENCHIPASRLLGDRRRGQRIFHGSLAFERGLILAPYLGVMRRQIERCVEYANERQQFGRPIGDNQAVSHRIATMIQRYHSCRLVARDTAQRLYAGENTQLFASLAKWTLSEAACASSQDVLRILGAPAYMKDSEVDKDILDSLGGLIYSGTSEIQKNIVCSELGLR